MQWKTASCQTVKHTLGKCVDPKYVILSTASKNNFSIRV